MPWNAAVFSRTFPDICQGKSVDVDNVVVCRCSFLLRRALHPRFDLADGSHSMKWYCIRPICLPADQVKDMLVPEKCENAADMDGIAELPAGFREATIACLEAIRDVSTHRLVDGLVGGRLDLSNWSSSKSRPLDQIPGAAGKVEHVANSFEVRVVMHGIIAQRKRRRGINSPLYRDKSCVSCASNLAGRVFEHETIHVRRNQALDIEVVLDVVDRLPEPRTLADVTASDSARDMETRTRQWAGGRLPP